MPLGFTDITISLSDHAHTTVSLHELCFSWKLYIFPIQPSSISHNKGRERERKKTVKTVSLSCHVLLEMAHKLNIKHKHNKTQRSSVVDRGCEDGVWKWCSSTSKHNQMLLAEWERGCWGRGCSSIVLSTN